MESPANRTFSAGAQESVKNFKKSSYRTFKSLQDAEKWLREQEAEEFLDQIAKTQKTETPVDPPEDRPESPVEPVPDSIKAAYWAVANGRTIGLFDNL